MYRLLGVFLYLVFFSSGSAASAALQYIDIEGHVLESTFGERLPDVGDAFSMRIAHSPVVVPAEGLGPNVWQMILVDLQWISIDAKSLSDILGSPSLFESRDFIAFNRVTLDDTGKLQSLWLSNELQSPYLYNDLTGTEATYTVEYAEDRLSIELDIVSNTYEWTLESVRAGSPDGPSLDLLMNKKKLVTSSNESYHFIAEASLAAIPLQHAWLILVCGLVAICTVQRK
jgi:hypothetical protein